MFSRLSSSTSRFTLSDRLIISFSFVRCLLVGSRHDFSIKENVWKSEMIAGRQVSATGWFVVSFSFYLKPPFEFQIVNYVFIHCARATRLKCPTATTFFSKNILFEWTVSNDELWQLSVYDAFYCTFAVNSKVTAIIH